MRALASALPFDRSGAARLGGLSLLHGMAQRSLEICGVLVPALETLQTPPQWRVRGQLTGNGGDFGIDHSALGNLAIFNCRQPLIH